MRDRSIIKRRRVYHLGEEDMLSDSAATGSIDKDEKRIEVEDLEAATLVGSKMLPWPWGEDDDETLHMPVIDIDFEASLVPSRTSGHFHLYLNRSMSWERYVVLLQALAQAGIIEWGYYHASIMRGQTFVRWPREAS